jgi:hypothetical protein
MVSRALVGVRWHEVAKVTESAQELKVFGPGRIQAFGVHVSTEWGTNHGGLGKAIYLGKALGLLSWEGCGPTQLDCCSCKDGLPRRHLGQ